jgi:copper resistance protein B
MSVTLAITLAAAQMPGMNHVGHRPGMTMPMPKLAAKPRTTAKPKPKPKPKPSSRAAKRVPRPSSAMIMTMPEVAPCSPEHAAMGHCEAPASTTTPGPFEPCPPEQAAMGHCHVAPVDAAASGITLPASDALARTR